LEKAAAELLAFWGVCNSPDSLHLETRKLINGLQIIIVALLCQFCYQPLGVFLNPRNKLDQMAPINNCNFFMKGVKDSRDKDLGNVLYLFKY
jgi:hypothetical protein